VRYEGPVVEGVKHFQARHGLEPDGIIGRGTRAAMAVPLSWRVRQIELALERLRWLPGMEGRRVVALNIPAFYLWAWDEVTPTSEPTFGMRAIVGRAQGTRTPVFDALMREVIFRPYWNIPRSILVNEILPSLGRDPDYLSRNDMEMVRGQGDDAPPVPETAENLALLEQGALRLRQRPGPRNALGLVKFDFPNEQNVYMHDTPARQLFERTRRDFSHGCVRVEDPGALAAWVLRDQPEWTPARILAAMHGGATIHASVSRPPLVILFYLTAMVLPGEEDTIAFADDLYGHDATLHRMLARQ
jgi:murein L,D-transpeptidase YcbB/YkuD